jgi:hypothetical protein
MRHLDAVGPLYLFVCNCSDKCVLTALCMYVMYVCMYVCARVRVCACNYNRCVSDAPFILVDFSLVVYGVFIFVCCAYAYCTWSLLILSDGAFMLTVLARLTRLTWTLHLCEQSCPTKDWNYLKRCDHVVFFYHVDQLCRAWSFLCEIAKGG